MQSLCLISSAVCGNVEALEAPPLEHFIFMPLDKRTEHCMSSEDRLKILMQRLINSDFFLWRYTVVRRTGIFIHSYAFDLSHKLRTVEILLRFLLVFQQYYRI